MTTQTKNNLPTHVAVSQEDYCLDINTTILLEQLRTIDKSRLRNPVGKLSNDTMRRVDEALRVSLALNKERKEETKLNEMVHIGKADISIKEYKGQRVVTFKDIDMAHGRPDGTARKRFADNRKHFVEGEDFFIATPQDLENAEMSEKRTLENDITSNRGTALITEQGYLMLVKSFTDDLAWEVQRQLVNGYFRARKPLSQVEMMRIQLGMIDDHENRLSNLENHMTIDYGQQRILEKAVNKTVLNALGGKESNAYKEISKKVFAECNRDLKNYFQVNSRNDVPKVRFEDALKYAESWKPCTNTEILIRDCNAQMNM